MLLLLLIIFIFADVKFIIVPLLAILLIVLYYVIKTYYTKVNMKKDTQMNTTKVNKKHKKNIIENDRNINITQKKEHPKFPTQEFDMSSVCPPSDNFYQILQDNYSLSGNTEDTFPLPYNIDCDFSKESMGPDTDNVQKIDPDMFLSYEDRFDKMNIERQFYLPNDELISDQTTFAKWCFGTQPTCKEGFNCSRNDRLL